MVKKKVTVVESTKVRVNLAGMKPSKKSKLLSNLVLNSLVENKDHVSPKTFNHETLNVILKSIFTGDSESIKDGYATLVTYLVLHSKDISYDVFSGIYESVKLSCEGKGGMCYALPYCALINSGIILKWEPEQQSQIVLKMLKIHQNEPGTSELIFHYLIPLGSKVTLSLKKLKKITITSPRELFFMLSMDGKQSKDCPENSLLNSSDIIDIIPVIFQDCDLELRKNISNFLAKKLLSFSDDTLFIFWKKMEEMKVNSYYMVLLLSSVLYNCKDKSIDLNRLFSVPIIKALSPSAHVKPEYNQVFKSIQTSLIAIVPNLPFESKLETLNSIIIHTKLYLNKSMIVKLSQILLRNLKFDEVKQICKLYKQFILNKKFKVMIGTKSKEFNEAEKNILIKHYSNMIGSNFCKHEIDWRSDQIKFLFELGFSNEFKDVVTSTNQNIARQCFYDCLNQKCGSLADLDKMLKSLVKFASEKVAEKDSVLVVQFRDDAHNLWFKTIRVIKELVDNEDSVVFRILLRYMMLCIFSNYSNSRNTLEELFKVIENKDLKSGEMHWTEVMIDLYLHLLSNEETPHRSIVNFTFSQICKFMTNKGLELILSVIKGQHNDDEGSESDDISEGSDESSENEDAENVESESSNEENESCDEDEHEGQIDKLKDALRQELYKIDTASTCGSVDLDELDDDEGKQLNSTLGEIFKQQHGKFKDGEKNKVDNFEIQFRIRVIDLLETYIGNKPSLYSCTVMLTSLISALKSSTPNHTLAPFSVCLKKCLKKLTELKEFSDVDCVTSTSICSILNQILTKDCSVSVFQDLTEQIVDSFLFLVQASSHIEEKSGEIPQYLSTVIAEFRNSDHIPLQLLSGLFLRLSLEELSNLLPKVVKYSFSSKLKYFKRQQYLQLLIIFYNNNRLFQNINDYKEFLLNIENQIIKELIKAINQQKNENEFNVKYFCMIFDLLSLLKVKNKILTDKPGLHWSLMSNIVETFSQMPCVKKQLRVSFINFRRIFKDTIDNDLIESGKKLKRKLDEVNECIDKLMLLKDKKKKRKTKS